MKNFSFLSLDRAEPTPGLIVFYGGFQHRDTYNILLEYADGGTLEDVFQKLDPPSRGFEINAFWRSFLEIFKGVEGIHELSRDGQDLKGSKVFQG